MNREFPPCFVVYILYIYLMELHIHIKLKVFFFMPAQCAGMDRKGNHSCLVSFSCMTHNNTCLVTICSFSNSYKLKNI